MPPIGPGVYFFALGGIDVDGPPIIPILRECGLSQILYDGRLPPWLSCWDTAHGSSLGPLVFSAAAVARVVLRHTVLCSGTTDYRVERGLTSRLFSFRPTSKGVKFLAAGEWLFNLSFNTHRTPSDINTTRGQMQQDHHHVWLCG